MDGLTFPGIIDDPGWTGGSCISASPEVGPELRRRRSLLIRRSSMASSLRADEMEMRWFLLCNASNELVAGVN